MCETALPFLCQGTENGKTFYSPPWNLEMSLGEEVLKSQGDLKTKQSKQHLTSHKGFSGGSVVKNPPADARDLGSIPGSGRSPGGGHGNPLQCSCLENPMDRGAWRAAVYGVTKQTKPHPAASPVRSAAMWSVRPLLSSAPTRALQKEGGSAVGGPQVGEGRQRPGEPSVERPPSGAPPAVLAGSLGII